MTFRCHRSIEMPVFRFQLVWTLELHNQADSDCGMAFAFFSDSENYKCSPKLLYANLNVNLTEENP